MTPGAGGVTDYNYVFENTGNTVITELVLPEVQAGEFIAPSVTGWSVSEDSTSPLSPAPDFKPAGSPTPAEYLDFTATAGGIGVTDTLDFTLESNTSTYLNSQATISDGILTGTVDPPTPDPVPEPSTLALLGVAAAGAVAARRKRG